MKTAYVDTSVLIAILFEEPGCKKYLEKLNSFDECLTSFLTEAELLSACKREKTSFEAAKLILNALTFIGQESPFFDHYLTLFKLGYVKGADAFHLATALFLDPEATELAFFSLDAGQLRIAKELGFKLQTGIQDT